MTEHKYTDEEVILAHRCCTDIGMGCLDCPFGNNELAEGCASLNRLVLALINRQKAEIAFWMDAAANAKKEAVKEFADKLKKEEWYFGRQAAVSTIDYLVKEFTEEKT